MDAHPFVLVGVGRSIRVVAAILSVCQQRWVGPFPSCTAGSKGEYVRLRKTIGMEIIKWALSGNRSPFGGVGGVRREAALVRVDGAVGLLTFNWRLRIVSAHEHSLWLAQEYSPNLIITYH